VMRDVGGIISVYAREQVYDQVSRQLAVNDQVSGHVWEVVSRGIYVQVGARVYNQVDGKSGWRRSVTSL
jgi:hypothetical protein